MVKARAKRISTCRIMSPDFRSLRIVNGLRWNPEGQWGWIEENTGLPIADAIARYLLKGTE